MAARPDARARRRPGSFSQPGRVGLVMSNELVGKVCVVAGATRGAGRGIAVALGERGATVHCVGRSVRGATTGRPETIDESAELVTRAGGRGIAAPCDLLDEAQVRALFERLPRVDVLVNDAWSGDELAEWGKPAWELDLQKAWRMIENALRTHLHAARHAIPRMPEGALLVEITDGDTGMYRGNLPYDIVKSTIVRLAWGLAEELRPRGVASVAVTPGFLRSEAMLDRFGVTEANWRDGAKQDPHFAFSETPLFVGRAVAALAADADIMEKSGRVFASWTISDEYGFADADGARPHWGRHFAEAFGKELQRPLDEGYYAYWRGWEQLKTKLT